MKQFRILSAAAVLPALVLGAPAYGKPQAPDYAHRSAWAALPDMVDGADVVPEGSGAVDRQATARADVFFIHPTTFYGIIRPNAAFDEGGRTKTRLDSAVLRNQASVFNGCCRIYAPRYRQASLRVLITHSHQKDAAIDLAYSDVRRAFEFYLARYNAGRPFIIASHSQGSILGMRLVQEVIAPSKLRARMIAAYLIGSMLPLDITRAGVPVCGAPTQTGCVINWNSMPRGADDTRRKQTALIWLDGAWGTIGNRRVVCVNPLTWTAGGAAPAAANIGAERGGRSSGALAPVTPHFTDADCQGSRLFVDVPDGSVPKVGGSYHNYDYNLFYMNIRANAEARTRAYLAKHR